MPTNTEDAVAASVRTFQQMQAERRLEIHTQCGRLHFDTDDVEEAVSRYRKTFGLAPEITLTGTVTRWADGVEAGKPEPLHVVLASRAELREKSDNESKVQGPKSKV